MRQEAKGVGAQQKKTDKKTAALMRLKPKQIFQIARIIIRAIRAALDEVETAKSPNSPGGRRVTSQEAVDVAAACLGSLVEPIADILTDAT